MKIIFFNPIKMSNAPNTTKVPTPSPTPEPEDKLDIRIIIALGIAVLAFLGLIYYIYTSAAEPSSDDLKMESMVQTYTRPALMRERSRPKSRSKSGSKSRSKSRSKSGSKSRSKSKKSKR